MQCPLPPLHPVPPLHSFPHSSLPLSSEKGRLPLDTNLPCLAHQVTAFSTEDRKGSRARGKRPKGQQQSQSQSPLKLLGTPHGDHAAYLLYMCRGHRHNSSMFLGWWFSLCESLLSAGLLLVDLTPSSLDLSSFSSLRISEFCLMFGYVDLCLSFH